MALWFNKVLTAYIVLRLASATLAQECLDTSRSCPSQYGARQSPEQIDPGLQRTGFTGNALIQSKTQLQRMAGSSAFEEPAAAKQGGPTKRLSASQLQSLLGNLRSSSKGSKKMECSICKEIAKEVKRYTKSAVMNE